MGTKKQNQTKILPVHDVAIAAIEALERANDMLARLALTAISPRPNKELARLLETIPSLAMQYLAMQQQERRDFEKRAVVDPASSIFNVLATFTERQRTEILTVCSSAEQQKMLLDIFAKVPVATTVGA